MDGLLVDSEPLWQEAEIEVFAELGVTLTRADCWATKGLRVDETVAHWLKRRPWSGATASEVEARLRARVLELIRARAVPKEGARHALSFLRAAGLRLALASSSSMELIGAVLERLDMEREFEVVRSAADEPHGKPHPAVYLKTAASLGVAAGACVALEDSLPGVAAAKAAGMLCIAVPDDASGPVGQAAHFGEGPLAADLTLRSLIDLDAQVLRRLGIRSQIS
jgi:sugar-phosphatase